MSDEVILILGGTKEAAELALKLTHEKPSARIISSMAGRTKEPRKVVGEMRIGGFGGVAGFVQYLDENNVTKIIDATHPFAKQISKNAEMAADKTGIELEVITRKPWQKQEADQWIEVGSLEEARDKIPPYTQVLLALGSQHIDMFKTRSDVHFLVRMVDKPETPIALPNHIIELGKPGDKTHEIALLKNHNITHIICRNSGGKGAYAKIEAARALGIIVIIISP